MEMTLLTAEQLRLVYDRDLSVSFPRDELKPFRAMERMLDRGSYRAWGLMDGEDIAGLATVWNYAPGWALFDYLCVAPHRRSDGLGSRLVQELALAERDNVLFGESELPEFAPDPDMARRRIGFYKRNGAKEAGYDMTLFGVPYRVLYWAEQEVDPLQIARQHTAVYQNRFARPLYDKYITIPWSPRDGMPDRVDWAKAEEEFE